MTSESLAPAGAVRRRSRTTRQEGWVEEVGKKVRSWRGHYFVYSVSADGTKKRQHKVINLGPKAGLKKWEAEDKLRALIDQRTSHNRLELLEVTFEWFWLHRYLPMREPSWSRNTQSAVTSVVSRHILPVLGGSTLTQITRFALQTQLNDVAKRMSRSVAKKVRVYVKDILDEALEQDLIPKNPARKLDMPRTRKPCDRYLSTSEVAKLLNALTGRDRLIVGMFVLCALRPGELFALRRECIEDGRLRIKEAITRGEIQNTKTEESNGYVALPPSLEAELHTWLQSAADHDPRAFVFPSRKRTPLDAHNYLRRFLKPTADRLGIRGVTFQSLRRTFATLIQSSGTVKDAQTQLRHADAQTTMNSYQKAIPASVSSAVESLERHLKEAERKSEDALDSEPSAVRADSTSITRTNSRAGIFSKGPTPNAQLLHNFSERTFSTVNGNALNRRGYVVRPIGFEPMAFCSGGKRSIRAELRAHVIPIIDRRPAFYHDLVLRFAREVFRGAAGPGSARSFSIFWRRFGSVAVVASPLGWLCIRITPFLPINTI